DETNINILNPPHIAIRIKGSNDVKVKCPGNFKASITVGLTISASGSKLKPIIIAKGLTKRCLNKFNLKKDTIGTFTSSGWINESRMMLVLDQLAQRTNNEKSVLLLDQYEAHKTNLVKEYA